MISNNVYYFDFFHYSENADEFERCFHKWKRKKIKKNK